MDNCQSCFPECPNNACQTKLVTLPCDPNSKELWFKYQMPSDLDPVLSNIYNGCWMCNYEPAQTVNNKMCQRNFQDIGGFQPYNLAYQTDIDSIVKNINKCVKQKYLER